MFSVETATRFLGRWVVNANIVNLTAPGAYFNLAFLRNNSSCTMKAVAFSVPIHVDSGI